MATAKRTRPRAVVGAPHRAAWQLKSVLRHSISAAPCTIIFYIFFVQLLLVNTVFIRGGVELEAKAKDTKKNPRPRTAFPRTDTLEAKDRNARGQGQGPRTLALVLSKKKKKKALHKNFSNDLHKKTFSKKFFKSSTKF